MRFYNEVLDQHYRGQHGMEFTVHTPSAFFKGNKFDSYQILNSKFNVTLKLFALTIKVFH